MLLRYSHKPSSLCRNWRFWQKSVVIQGWGRIGTLPHHRKYSCTIYANNQVDSQSTCTWFWKYVKSASCSSNFNSFTNLSNQFLFGGRNCRRFYLLCQRWPRLSAMMIESNSLTASQVAEEAECGQATIINIRTTLRQFGSMHVPPTWIGWK